MSQIQEKITSNNVGKLTTFQIRQELISKGKFDLPENQVNHDNMLRRLIAILLEEENEELNRKNKDLEANRLASLEEAKRIREEKKREAIERSKQRQADPKYFSKIKEINEEVAKNEESKNQASNSTKEEDDEVAAELDDDVDNDPFRTIKSKSRNKISVK